MSERPGFHIGPAEAGHYVRNVRNCAGSKKDPAYNCPLPTAYRLPLRRSLMSSRS